MQDSRVVDSLRKRKEIVAVEEKISSSVVTISIPQTLNRTGKILLLASAFASVGFWITGHFLSGFWLTPYGAKTLLKWLSIACITVMVMRYCNMRASRQEFWFVIALICHSLGDVIIAQEVLLPALPVFFLGHLFYIFMFKFDLPSGLKGHLRRMTKKKMLLWIVMATWGFTLGLFIIPMLSVVFLFPVVGYMAIIFCVASVSMIPIYKFRWMVLGVILYCASDTLIAIDLFYMRLGFLAMLTWPLYYLSQLFLAVGFLKEKGKVGSIFIAEPIEFDPIVAIKQTRVYAFCEKFVRRINLPV